MEPIAAINRHNKRSAPMTDQWMPVCDAPDREVLLTRIDDANGVRNQQKLVRDGNLWWLPDRSMYVYYTPTHWLKTS
jgi:hypothetical protein